MLALLLPSLPFWSMGGAGTTTTCAFSRLGWPQPPKGMGIFPYGLTPDPWEELSHGKMFRCSFSWKNLSQEQLLPGWTQFFFFLEPPFSLWETNLEHPHSHGFYQVSRNYPSRKQMSVCGPCQQWTNLQ